MKLNLPSLYLFLFALFLTQTSASQDLVFNEVMSSNQLNISDSDGGTPDWFELYNASQAEIDLGQYQVSDKADGQEAWSFPSYTLGAGQYLLVFASGKDRKDLPLFWNTLITQGDKWKYLVPSTEPDPNWKNNSFNDSGWSEGSSGFGYGDGDDNTDINGIQSIFIRKKFTIANVDAVVEGLLHMDYDDAFVAYLNGVEIARANITSNGAPAFNAFADNSSHEARMYQGGIPDKYPIENIGSLLVNGDNVLAIQVHNAGSNSSDLTAIPFLTLGFSTQVSVNTAPFIDIPLKKFHTNFKISAEGESLYLFKNGTLSDSIQVPELPANISYGRNEAGDFSWQYFNEPTPEAMNNTDGFNSITGSVTFSVPGGIYQNSVSVSLSTNNASDHIYYTLDGTEPTTNSILLYGNYPFPITENTVVRARIINDGALPGKISTQSYFINISHELPIISLATDPANFFDPYIGIYVNGAVKHPLSGKDCDNGENFWQDWERPVHVSMINPDGSLAFEQNAGVKVFGGCSRSIAAQKSLSLRFRKSYGEDGLHYKVFDDRDVDTFYSLNLRNSGNDWNNTMFKDGLMSSLIPEQLDKQAFQPAVVYINGEYWGIHNIRERFSEDYVSTHHNVDAETVNMMEFHVNNKLHEVEGDGQTYMDLLDFMNTHDLALEDSYDHVKSVIDIENFALYQATNIIIKNTDWPGNNVKFWSSNQLDSKWRWMVYDLDFGFSDTYHNTLTFALEENGPNWPNPPESTFLLRQLNENQEFKYLFINSFADILNKYWNPEYVNSIIEKRSNAIHSEIEDHMQRWGGINYQTWNNRVNSLYNFASTRPDVVRNFVKNYYGLSGNYTLTLSVNDNKGEIQVNSITPENYNWTGTYFTDVPITLIAKPAKGYRFSRWFGASSSTNDTIMLIPNSDTKISAIFEEDEQYEDVIVINEIFYTNTAEGSPQDWVELFNNGVEEVDLSGWNIKDEDDAHTFIIPNGTVLNPGAFLVICRDSTLFSSYYKPTGEYLGNMDFGLSNTTDCVRLFNSQEVLVDSVGYTNMFTGNTTFSYQRFEENTQEIWYQIEGAGTPNAHNEKGVILGNGHIMLAKPTTIDVYPNPFTESLHLKLKMASTGQVNISVYSLKGDLMDVITHQTYLTGTHNINWLHPGNLTPGVYMVRIQTPNEVITRKIIKQ